MLANPPMSIVCLGKPRPLLRGGGRVPWISKDPIVEVWFKMDFQGSGLCGYGSCPSVFGHHICPGSDYLVVLLDETRALGWTRTFPRVLRSKQSITPLLRLLARVVPLGYKNAQASKKLASICDAAANARSITASTRQVLKREVRQVHKHGPRGDDSWHVSAKFRKL